MTPAALRSAAVEGLLLGGLGASDARRHLAPKLFASRRYWLGRLVSGDGHGRGHRRGCRVTLEVRLSRAGGVTRLHPVAARCRLAPRMSLFQTIVAMGRAISLVTGAPPCLSVDRRPGHFLGAPILPFDSIVNDYHKRRRVSHVSAGNRAVRVKPCCRCAWRSEQGSIRA